MQEAATSSGIAGNDLNRCDAPALQHKIRAKSKRIAVFFVDSKLRVVRVGGGGWKRVALDGNKERFVQKKGFWFVNMEFFCGQRRKACAKAVFVRNIQKSEYHVQNLSIAYISLSFEVVPSGNRAYAAHI